MHPLGTQKLSGYITVATEHGIAAKTDIVRGPDRDSLRQRARRAGRRAAAAPWLTSSSPPRPAAAPAWKLSVTTEAVEPWVRAEIMNTITLTETLVSGRTLVKYDIANAPVKEFRVRVPAAFKNVEITGAQIRRRDQTNGEWRVELQGKVRGEYLLTVTWEMPRSGQTNLVELAGVQALGVEREAGFRRRRSPGRRCRWPTNPPANCSAGSTCASCPQWAGRPDAATVLAYRYLRPGYKLALEARRFDEAEVLQALIDSARLTTVVADDGQMMTEVSPEHPQQRPAASGNRAAGRRPPSGPRSSPASRSAPASARASCCCRWSATSPPTRPSPSS